MGGGDNGARRLTDVLAFMHEKCSASETGNASQGSVTPSMALLLRLLVGVSAAIASLAALLIAGATVGR